VRAAPPPRAPPRDGADSRKTDAQRHEEEEEQILAAIARQKKLVSGLELARGIQYTDALATSWRPPRFVRERSAEEHDRLREKYHIIVDGEDIPPPIESFAVRFPPSSSPPRSPQNTRT
jgi:ATP-dependent RNA helicase DDX41